MKTKPTTTPRGIRNNNPLNIRIGNTWLGEVSNPTDSEFEQFCHILYGLRAAFVILRRYIRRYGRNTVRKIISAWAPASENNLQVYISNVSRVTGIDPDTIIDFADEKTMTQLVAAMALQECGQPIKMDDIIKAYQMA